MSRSSGTTVAADGPVDAALLLPAGQETDERARVGESNGTPYLIYNL